MASEIYDAPRSVMLELPDGTRKQTQTMQTIIDRQSGDIVTINDINQIEFEVFTRIGPSFESQREQTMDRLDDPKLRLSNENSCNKLLS